MSLQSPIPRLGRDLSTGADSQNPLSFEVHLPPGHLGLLLPIDQQATKGHAILLQEGGLLPGPKTGLLSDIRERVVQGDTRADQATECIGKGHPGRVRSSREPRKTDLPCGFLSQVLC